MRKSQCATATALPRTECHIFERAAILAQRDLALGAAVEVIKHRVRQAAHEPFRRKSSILTTWGGASVRGVAL